MKTSDIGETGSCGDCGAAIELNDEAGICCECGGRNLRLYEAERCQRCGQRLGFVRRLIEWAVGDTHGCAALVRPGSR